MSMSRKDYEGIAGAIRKTAEEWRANAPAGGDEHLHCGIAALMDVTSDIAAVLVAGNPRFDRGRFVEATGLYDEEHAHG